MSTGNRNSVPHKGTNKGGRLMNDVLNRLYLTGIVPVIKIDDAQKAVPLAKALIKGGISCAEVTFRTTAAEDAIGKISKELPDMLVGAGTVLTIDQVDRAVAAGAKFIVSPGFNPEVVNHCISKGIPITPGCSSPTDIEKAIEAGLNVIKFFPAEQLGGLNFLKAVSAPYGNIKFMPTGGINLKNLESYMAFDKILACGGTWMVNPQLINEDKFEEIEALTEEAVNVMHGFELVHIGINAQNSDEAVRSANLFRNLFGFKIKEGESSIFASNRIEIMREPKFGKSGHIGIGTFSVERAQHFLESKGFKFSEETSRFDAEGKKTFVYLEDEICGFKIHLVNKK